MTEKQLLLATGHKRAGGYDKTPFDLIVLAHDERALRRKRLVLQHGDAVLVNLPQLVRFNHGDVLELNDGRLVEIIAAEEDLYAITGSSPLHLTELAWHIGNRHLAAQVEPERLLILRDPVIRQMLEGLGAEVEEVSEPFHPLGGAYDSAGHGHALGHSHSHHHHHDHE